MSAAGNVSPNNFWSPAAINIITLAYQILAVINEDEVPTYAQFTTGMNTLNAVIKELQATGLHIWTEQEGIQFLQPKQVRYLLGNNSPDHAADAFSYINTALTANAPAGSQSLMLASVEGLVDGMQIGIVLDTGAIFWTTLREAGSAVEFFFAMGGPLFWIPTFSTQVTDFLTLADPLPSSASSGNIVFAYETNIVRPLRVPSARRIAFTGVSNQGPIETPLTPPLARQDYMDLPNKFTPGTVTQFFYNPARDVGEMFVWPAPQNGTNAIRFTWYRPINIFDVGTNTADLPDEWTNALIWSLARELGINYSVAPERWDRIVATAAQKYELVQGWDREPQSVFMGRSFGGARGGR